MPQKKFMKYVLQSSFSMIGLSVYILADTFFISLASGADGIAVLNLALPLYGLIYAIGSMIAVGSATRYALTKGQSEESKIYFSHALLWQLIVSIPFILMGFLAPDKYLGLMGADPQLSKLGQSYVQIVFWGTPAFMMNYTMTSFVRNDNAPTKAMIASLTGSAFNIVFDYIFMFPLGMGLKGAALATALSPVVSMLMTSLHYRSRACRVHLHRTGASLRRLKDVCQLGFPAFVGEMSSAITTTVFNSLILLMAGNVGVAAYGVVANYSLVAMAIFNGISQGTQPLLSEAFGKGKHEEVRLFLKLGMLVSILSELFIIAVTWIFTDPLVQFFNSEGNELLSNYAQRGMRLFFLGYLLAGVNIFLINSFSALAKAEKAFWASLLRGVIGITACAFLLSRLMGMNGIWLSFLAAELITGCVILAVSGKMCYKNSNYDYLN